MSTIEGLLEFLFPSRCLVCRRRSGVVLCPECRRGIRILSEPLCRICGVPMARAGIQICSVCREEPPPFKAARGVGAYEGTLRKAIHALKYGGRKRMAMPLAGLMAEYFQEHALSPHVLVPVPLHPSRERTRGFNQAFLLASHLSEAVQVPVAAGAVEKVRPTSSQRILSREERRMNLQGAFRVMEPRTIRGRSVLLVDDVMTTGATLAEVARVLLEGGAEEVSCLCPARDLLRREPHASRSVL